jgi:hypothetical protein
MLRCSDMKQYSKDAWKEGYTPESWSEHQSFVFWSRIIGVIAVLITLLVLFPIRVTFADTRHHRRTIPTPQAPVQVPSSTGSPVATPSPTPGNDSNSVPTGNPGGFCMNALHDNPTSASAIMAEIKAVKAAGFNCIRLAYMNFNNSYSEQGALDANSLGMYVILGAEWGTFTQSQFSQYESEAITQFKWCQANGIQQCSLGNEQEYRLSGISSAQWISDAKQIALAAKAVYGGTISYETSGDFTSDWTSGGTLGDVNLLGLNLYCGYTCNANYLQEAINAFGISHVYVSETGCDMGKKADGSWAVPSCHTDAGRAAEIKTDAVLLHKNFPSTPIYFFTWAANGSFNVPSFWAVNDDPLTLSALK